MTVLIAIGAVFFIGFLLILKSFILDDTTSTLQGDEAKRQWWTIKRGKYNVGLFIAGPLAFVLFLIAAEIFVCPNDDFEVTIFTIFFQAIGYLFMMVLANVLFSLGYFVDKMFNKADSQSFRESLFKAGFWFSVSLPFLIPLLIVIKYVFNCYQ